MNINTFR